MPTASERAILKSLQGVMTEFQILNNVNEN